jgi:protocatechuate 3,4-dioxygenase beta subunit
LKSAKCGEADVLRSGLDLSHGSNGPLELEIGADGGRIEGSVTDGEDRPIDGARVALIADVRSGPSREKVTVTDAKGAFTISGIAPGDYKLYTSRNLVVSALHDPVYVKQVGPHAKLVSIHEHGVEHLQVKAIAAEALPSR